MHAGREQQLLVMRKRLAQLSLTAALVAVFGWGVISLVGSGGDRSPVERGDRTASRQRPPHPPASAGSAAGARGASGAPVESVAPPIDAGEPPSRHSVEVLVLAEGGAVLGAAQLALEPSHEAAIRRVAPGHFVVTLAGRAVLSASAPGWGETSAPLEPAARPARIELTLRLGAVAWGTMLDQSGRPCGGEELLLTRAVNGSVVRERTSTNSVGVFPYAGDSRSLRTVGLRGTPCLDAPFGSAFPYRRFESVAIESREPLTLRAPRLGGLLLDLRDDAGEGWQGGEVDVLMSSGQGAGLGGEVAFGDDGPTSLYVRAPVDPRGRCVVPVTHPNRWSVQIGRDGFLAEPFAVTVPDIGWSGPFRATRVDRGELSARVVDPGGRPLGGCWVMFAPVREVIARAEWKHAFDSYDRRHEFPAPATPGRTTSTDQDGAFSLPWQVGSLVIQHPGYVPRVIADASAWDAGPIALLAGNVIEGRLSDPGVDGGDLSSHVVRLAGPGDLRVPSLPREHVVPVRDDGTFRITAIRPGTHRLLVEDDREVALRRQVDVAEGDELWLDLTLETRHEVRVVIPGSDGALRRVSLVRVADGVSVSCTSTSTDSWGASLDWVGATRLQVATLSGGFSYELATLEVLPGQEEYYVELPGGSCDITLEVPGEAYPCSLSVTAGPNGSMVSHLSLEDVVDVVRVDHLPPGPYDVLLRPAPGSSLVEKALLVARTQFEIASWVDARRADLVYDLRSVRFLVVDADGQPLPDMRVSASRDGVSLGVGATRADGICELLLPRGEGGSVFAYSQSAPMSSSAHQFRAEDESIEIVVRDTVQVIFAIERADPASPLPETIRLHSLVAEGYGGVVRVGPHDRFAGPLPLPPGPWDVEVQWEHGALQTVAVTVDERRRQTIRVDVP